ncbi:hypothetical protein PYW08_016303 [Mythimna loreyi]|uniref:Uncharacterized protein n=1 Tax=Mythimna loreyi TaxID=667449 RepID=A0ACC2QWM3_9NEOP|nr:hypothetical protein PYW08_016303 [Mythimna loreyi]
MIHHDNFIDRLFLAQSNGESVYIDDYEIPRDSIDGIRFLYKKFNLRKGGVILNEKDRILRNTQVCLFIRAVRPLLSRPILILCQEGYEYCWVGRFEAWCANMINDVTVETQEPFIKKKMVVINTMVNLHKFCARQWSIIVVDGDAVTSPNPILMLPFKSCFKIWCTEINMKENLEKFEEAYKWIFPREIFDKYFFIPKDIGNAVDVVEKSILLDAFFEEVLIKRNNSTFSHENHIPKRRPGSTVFGPNRSSSMVLGNTTIRLSMPAPKEVPMVVGDTLITRTKVDPGLGTSRMVGDTTITSTSTPPSTSGFKTNRETNISPNTDYIMSVCDTSITASNSASTSFTPTKPVPTVIISKKNKDATGTKIKRSKPKIEPEIFPPKLFESPMAVLAKLLEESPKTEPGEEGNDRLDYCIENFNKINGKDNGLELSNMERIKEEIKTEKLIEITELDEKPDGELHIASDKLVEMDTLVFGHDTLISQVTDNDVAGKGKNTETDKKEIEPHTILTCKPVGERTHNKLFTDNKKSTSSITYKSSARCSENERDEKNDRKKLKCKSLRSEETEVIEIDLDELNREMRALVTRDRPERLAKRQKTDSYETTTCFDESKYKFNGHNKEFSYSSNKITEQIINSLKRNNIDVQMKECEETVSKKFKGSLLDRLF